VRERERERDFQPGLYVHQNRMWHLHIAGASHMCAHVNMRWLSQDGRLITHKVGRSRLCAKRPTLSDRWTDAFEISRQRFPLLARSYARTDRRGLTLSRIPRGSSSPLNSRVLSSCATSDAKIPRPNAKYDEPGRCSVFAGFLITPGIGSSVRTYGSLDDIRGTGSKKEGEGGTLSGDTRANGIALS